jgi:hypothetical protein
MRALRRLPVIALVTVACACATACGRADAPAAARPGPDGLAAALHDALAQIERDPARADAIVAGWRLPEDAWGALVTDAYRAHWRDYAAAFDAAAPALADRLRSVAAAGAVRAQWQYADDPALTNAQIRVRWILPVGRPGVVAWVTRGGAGARDARASMVRGGAGPARNETRAPDARASTDERLDVVFVWDGAAWRALAGADDMIVAAVRAQRPGCLPALVAAGPAGRCTSIAWMIADAAMRAQPERLARACAIAAANGCGAGP